MNNKLKARKTRKTCQSDPKVFDLASLIANEYGNPVNLFSHNVIKMVDVVCHMD